VFNTSSSFNLATGGKALFIFDSLSGQIAAWNGARGTTAVSEFTGAAGSSVTGLAIGTQDFLYAANFGTGRIDVFNGSFARTTLPGTRFTDPATQRPTTTPNTGIVDVYDTNGNFLQRLVTNTHLDSPWGITQRPRHLGALAATSWSATLGMAQSAPST
jgi:sugar lactone lactonase YvrE